MTLSSEQRDALVPHAVALLATSPHLSPWEALLLVHRSQATVWPWLAHHERVNLSDEVSRLANVLRSGDRVQVRARHPDYASELGRVVEADFVHPAVVYHVELDRGGRPAFARNDLHCIEPKTRSPQ